MYGSSLDCTTLNVPKKQSITQTRSTPFLTKNNLKTPLSRKPKSPHFIFQSSPRNAWNQRYDPNSIVDPPANLQQRWRHDSPVQDLLRETMQPTTRTKFGFIWRRVSQKKGPFSVKQNSELFLCGTFIHINQKQQKYHNWISNRG